MATSIFVRMDSIKGESRERGHEDEIEALSWSWGISNATIATGPGRGGGSGRAGRPTFSEFTFVHRIDAASPLLMTACAIGQHIRKARVTVRKAGERQNDFLVIDLSEVMVSGVATSISSDADAGDEVVVLSFASVDLQYVPQGADGRPKPAIHFTHDLRTR